MNISDPIADLFTQIRNGQSVGKLKISLPSSKMKLAIANLIKNEGYVLDVKEEINNGKPLLIIELKYFQGKSVIESIKKISTPGLRIYKKCNELPKIQGGLGIAIISTSKGIMTDRSARVAGQGGEVLATIY